MKDKDKSLEKTLKVYYYLVKGFMKSKNQKERTE